MTTSGRGTSSSSSGGGGGKVVRAQEIVNELPSDQQQRVAPDRSFTPAHTSRRGSDRAKLAPPAAAALPPISSPPKNPSRYYQPPENGNSTTRVSTPVSLRDRHDSHASSIASPVSGGAGAGGGERRKDGGKRAAGMRATSAIVARPSSQSVIAPNANAESSAEQNGKGNNNNNNTNNNNTNNNTNNSHNNSHNNNASLKQSTEALKCGTPSGGYILLSSAKQKSPEQHKAPPATAIEDKTVGPALVDPSTSPEVAPAPSSGMYWSRAPLSGVTLPALRAHTATLVGSNIYIFGGCDAQACFNALYVLDADSFHWSKPQVTGATPPPLRAHTCTAVGKKLVIFGGGEGQNYYNDVWVLDTTSFRWTKPHVAGDRLPSKRRAHTACLYKNGIYIWAGGNGRVALSDMWRLDVSDMTKMSWKFVSARSDPPSARGYHTANMVGSKMIIQGGSDGDSCFQDLHVFDMESRVWSSINIQPSHRRLAQTSTIVGSYLFVIGGHDSDGYTNEVLLLNLVTMTWDRRRVYGLPLSRRGYHTTILYDSRLLTIGGFDGSEVHGDVRILELAVNAYYSQISHFTIEV